MYTSFKFRETMICRTMLCSCLSDEIDRCGIATDLSDEFLNIGVSLGTCKIMINNKITEFVNLRWAASNKGI